MRILIASIALLFSIAVSAPVAAQFQEGVYKFTDQEKVCLLIVVDGYLSYTCYEGNQFLGTKGGPYQATKEYLSITYEYNEWEPDKIGQTEPELFKYSSTDASLIDQKGNVWYQQKVQQNKLDGAWKITARKMDGQMKDIQSRGSRKTLKLLKDGYFQWIAIDPSEKKMYGTGGGYYTFQQKHYQEEILFFSRDSSRVGASLKFKGQIKKKQWHHQGHSSKGDPIYEIWSKDKN